MIDVSRTILPADDLLPDHVRDLQAQRDAAYDAWETFADEHRALLSDRWEETFEARDIVAAAEAVSAGKDPLKLKSELAAARDRRPRVIGAARELARAANAADRALVQAWKRSVASLAPVAAERLEAAAEAYADAYRAFIDARQSFGAATAFRRYVRVAQGAYTPDFTDMPQTPVRADGLAPNSPAGLQEIREVMQTFEGFDAVPPGDRRVTVQLPDGSQVELAYDQAVALVGSANNRVKWPDADQD
ncbi:hypothetical protein [Streptomyces sp. Ru87]|uniref:hypothetical protein n=1 Tax=Streptomyces sp. Ru87 TaxID=2044307 RepID=UPI000D1F2DA6|nr:hypothetical protein [Streptomyces sp. Ru87]